MRSCTLIVGVVLALVGGFTIGYGEALGFQLENVAVVGLALGAVIGLVPDQTRPIRLGGFTMGFLFGWLGYGLRTVWLSDAASGRAIALFLVVLACLGVCAATQWRVPLWSTLAGAVAIYAAYEDAYRAAPTALLSESPQAASTVILAAAVGFLVTVVTPAPGEDEDVRPKFKVQPPKSYLDLFSRAGV